MYLFSKNLKTEPEKNGTNLAEISDNFKKSLCIKKLLNKLIDTSEASVQIINSNEWSLRKTRFLKDYRTGLNFLCSSVNFILLFSAQQPKRHQLQISTEKKTTNPK